ncbi:MAG: NAD(P)H-hydrate epimerase [Phycisphaerae bacterium]|nr:NAD(P)H-hydrate epimerase [Phycisphaerae bacterium]
MSASELVLSREQVREVDRLAVERYRMPSILLMENAGRNAAEIARGRYGDSGSAVIACGTGNNGGDGFVIARHLHNGGWSVRIILAGREEKLTSDARTNHAIAEAMGISIVSGEDAEALRALAGGIGDGDVVFDALLGTGFRGEVRSPIAEFIAALNQARKRGMVAVDVPSGLDCETGTPANATIRADLTITFVAKKSGFAQSSAWPYLGDVAVADIGAPQALLNEVRRG